MPNNLTTNDAFQAAMGAAKALVSTASPTCLGIAYGMLAVQVFWMLSQVIVFQKGWHVEPVLKVVALIFFMSFYHEFAYSIVWTADYVSNLFEIKKEVLSALNKIATGNLEKSSSTSAGTGSSSLGIIPSFPSIPFDDFNSFLIWLMGLIQEGLSMVIRLLLSKMQVMLIAFMYVAGLFAATLSTVPSLGSSLLYWLKNLLNVLFWSLTLAILDNLIVFFLKNYQPDGADSTIDLVVLNLAIIILYISVPLLTSLYIGHAAISGVMSKMSGAVGGMIGGAAGFASKPFTDKAQERYKGALSSIKNAISPKNSANRNQ